MVKFEILLLEFPSSATCSANSVTFFQNLKVAMKKYLDPKLFLVIRLVTIRASMLAYVVLEFVCVGGCMQCLKVNCTVPSTIPFCFSLSLSLSYQLHRDRCSVPRQIGRISYANFGRRGSYYLNTSFS